MTIDPNTLTNREFSWQNAYLLCEAAKLAYSPPEQVRQALRDVWRMRGQVFSIGETQGFVGVNDDVVIVSFRGTQGLGDWGDNLRALPTEFGPLGGRAHSGFVHAWERAAPVVGRVLQEVGDKALWFTGHSLGGALALLAAASHAGQSPAGLVTFGQPRLLVRSSARKMRELFGARYARIVNDNDVVAKIPPFYRHTGQLFHFDHFGDLSEEALLAEGDTALPTDDNDGPEPMGEAEYEALIADIERLQEAETRRLMEGGDLTMEEEDGVPMLLADDLNVAIEGQVIGIAPHRIDRYVDLTRAMAFPPDMPDLSDAVSSLKHRSRAPVASRDAPNFLDFDLSESLPFESGLIPRAEFDLAEEATAAAQPAPEPRQAILIRLKRSGPWTPPPGLEIGSQVERIVTAFATAADLAALADDTRHVASVEVSREAGILELDRSMDFVGGTAAHRDPIAEKGDAALVGIVDTGIDILHEAFRGADGQTTRIVAIWDQRGSGGPTPRALNQTMFSQNYGRVYLRGDIDQFIANHNAGTPTHPRRLRDPDHRGRGGHGTHVAGIAAGRAVGRHPEGMAPEAGIVVVMSALSHADGDPTSIGYSVSHVDAVNFLKSVAEGGLPGEEEIKPIAINVSQGMNAGAHDGSSLLEAAFDMVTGIGRDEGCVIVKSAGNERHHRGHASKPLFVGIDTIEWQSDATVRRTDYFEGWFNGRDDVAFRVIGPSGRATAQITFDVPETTADVDGTLVEMRLTSGHRDNGDNRLSITIEQGAGQTSVPLDNDVWTLELEGRRIESRDEKFHIWAERNGVRATKFLVPDESTTLSIPGTARTVICVGASNSETPTRMNRSSSQGLTRTGEFKPDLAAPGARIKAAKSAQPALDAVTEKSGTSMAAPHVAGALALVMSKRAKEGGPQLNAEQLRTGLKVTVRSLGPAHHPLAGAGILDVEALLKHF